MSTRKLNTPVQELDNLESHLAGTLRRVSPPSDLVQRLKQRIYIPAREEIALRLQDWGRLFLVLTGVISGMLLIVTIARAFYHLFGKRDLG